MSIRLDEFVVRAIRMSDLDDLELFSKRTGSGMTSLPKNRGLLEKRITNSLTSFSKMLTEPKDESYTLVLEHVPSQKVIGTATVFARIGSVEPHFSYQIAVENRSSMALQKRKGLRMLRLKSVEGGPSEIGGLFILPEYRHFGVGRILSLSRFMLMASYPKRFSEMVMAEIRGVSDRNGRSAFWDAVGGHFFDMPFDAADQMASAGRKFVEELLPPHPIYVDLLPVEAQMVLGKPHSDAVAALRFLQTEGFRQMNEVDVFDGGPKVICESKLVRTIQTFREVESLGKRARAIGGEAYLVANNVLGDFRVTATPLVLGHGPVELLNSSLDVLKVESGAKLGVSPVFSLPLYKRVMGWVTRLGSSSKVSG